MLEIDQSRITPLIAEELVKLCPFGSISYDGTELHIDAGCRMCLICTKRGPAGIVRQMALEADKTDKSLWKGVAVLAENHPVSLEMLGKAIQLADKLHQPVYALVLGYKVDRVVEKMIRHGADAVYVADHPQLEHFRIMPYTNIFSSFIDMVKPAAVLVGSTSIGRALAPRVAARFGTGLTADCTALDIDSDMSLVQIRPAFGGNIMAQISTPHHRPQMCTVRYRVFSAPPDLGKVHGKTINMDLEPGQLEDTSRIVAVQPKDIGTDIADAEAIIAVGRGLKNKAELDLIHKLAVHLKAQVACTRPLVEAGWFDPRCQIGLSGRTVKPKLIITAGISGSVQFAAGMNQSECIIAINQDREAPIFNIAHYGFVGDLHAILPEVCERINDYAIQENR